MPTTYHQLKVQLWWMLPDSRDSHEEFLEAYRTFFSEQTPLVDVDATFSISEIYRKPNKNLYEEAIYHLDCTIEWPGVLWFGASTKYLQLGRAWCIAGRDKAHGKALFQWLVPSPLEAFQLATHPYDRDVSLSSVSFGTLVQLGVFVQHQLFSSSIIRDHRDYWVNATFHHDQRVLHIDLHLNHRDGCAGRVAEYRFVVPYLNILKVLINEKDRLVEIYLQLKIPAMLMGEVINDMPSRPGSAAAAAPLRWERHLAIGCDCIGGPVRTASLCGGLFLKLVLRDHSLARRVIGRLSQRCAHSTLFCYAPIRTYCPDAVVARWTNEVMARCEEMQRTLPFPCAYAFKAALHITFDVLDQMALMSTIDAGNVVMFAPAFYASCSMFKDEKPPQLARGTCLVRSVFVTPGRLILRPAQVHFENRILREFNAEFAIRVSFRDDNLDKLSFTLNLHSSRDALLNAVVARFLQDGLRVGAREFKFLAPSTSQLRDHGTWMYAADEQQNSAVTIREWMGKFEGIPNVAKRMARMGQCFSSTEQSVRVKACDVQEVPDIIGGAHPVSRKPYIFSDGVGMMSVPLAEEVYEVMKLKERPSAIQVRYAGAKGMLCVNPALPNKKLLCLRPSMQKFPCFSSEYLEVVKVSAPRIDYGDKIDAYSNVYTCLQGQEKATVFFTDALVNESRAADVLSAWSKLQLPYEDLSKAGFQLTLDPFFRSLLLAVYRNAVAGLRYKTRIALPVDRARNMLGVVDTTGKLQYGEVFVQCTEMRSPQVQHQEPPKKTVITGTVLVTKCPCLHPGDVRKFTAIDVPELHHVVDCIVFPAQGPRPHPDEMAGSDLDGDEYVVIWEKCLFFPGANRTPMNFSDRNPEPHGKQITIEDMIQFLCNYIKNDSIGILSNAHLAWADQEKEGIHSQKCLAIAEKISICLDFAKNGKTAFLRREERPMLYPDFMEKGSHKTTYRSDRALGVLYRTCRSLEAAVGRLGHRHVDPGRCQALAVPGWEEYRESATQALTDYNTNLRRILNQYGIGSEGEVMACMVNTFDTYHNAQSDKLNMEDLVEKMVKFLTVTTRDVFYEDILKEMQDGGISDQEELRRRKLRRASAWYMVTYEHSEENSFFSFPWCIADLLIEILRSADAEDKVWCPNILYWKIDHLVKENSDLAEDDGLDAGCDSFKTAFHIIEKWLKEETLLGQHEPGAPSKPGLCSNCLLDIYTEFLGSRKLAPVGKIVTRRRHAMMMSAAAKDEPSSEPTAEPLKEQSADKLISNKKASTHAWQIIDGFVEPLYLDESEGETDDPGMPDQGGQVDGNEQDIEEVTRSMALLLHQPQDGCDSGPDIGEDPSVGTLVVSFLRWCLEQHRLPRGTCRVGICAGGGYDCQTHRLPMVALRAYSSLAVSLDPCHISLPCDPAYHEPHQEIFERDPVRIQIANPAMDQMLKEKLNAVRQLLMRWTGVQDVQIQHQDDYDNTYIVVTATGRDWQIWFLEELLLQRWLPQAIDCGDLLKFLRDNPQAGQAKLGSRNLASTRR
ncbi:hypothetical protein HPB52_021365 [Rhipicephalus sanguineus]|uniref:RNA-directed RNA polymerase n=1 Tax=Rhipicephalus sanguineus TaxID=34632 RepID=A0A9D4PL07_RHISA|nr:hypothetical protein HPB52_021365 [Rhipicephalus sanguineus]